MKLQDAFAGYRIIHLSDLHISRKRKEEEIVQLIENVNAIHGDIIVITGDLIDDRLKYLNNHLKLFRKLNKPCYFVSGNHELVYAKKAIPALCDIIEAVYLDNDHVQIKRDNQMLQLAGLSDRFSPLFGIRRESDVLFSAIDKTHPIVLLAHQPKDVEIAKKHHVDLQLSGHTHAGQIAPFGTLVRCVQPSLYGLSKHGNTWMYVTSGIGTWGIHYRFRTQAEIAVMTLQKRDEEQP